MGGVKRKSLASMEKQQEAQDSGQEAGESPKQKKGKEKVVQQPKKQLSFLVPVLSDADAIKNLTPLKAITSYSASKALAVNASVATIVLRGLEAKNLLRKAGGFSGHEVWAIA